MSFQREACVFIFLIFSGTVIVRAQTCSGFVSPVFLEPVVPPNAESLDSLLTPNGDDFGLYFHDLILVMLEKVQGTFEKAQKLKSLVLEKIEIDVLSPPGVDALVGSDVRHLKLFRVTGIHAWKFSNNSLPNLEILEIIDCSLFYISPELAGLGNNQNLRKICIRNSEVIWLHKNVFEEQTNLEWLSLEGNKIKDLSRADMPRDGSRLKYLNLSANKLESLSDLMLSDFSALQELHVRNNQLKTLYLASFSSTLHELWIEGNKIECESLCWLYKLKEEFPLSTGLGWAGEPCFNETVTVDDPAAFCVSN